MTTYRFIDRDAAEHWADEYGGTVEYRPPVGSRIINGCHNAPPYVVVVDDDVEPTAYLDRHQR